MSSTTQEQVACLTATDVTTGLVSSAIVPKKGVDDYSTNELIRFILESGRGGGELQPGVLKSDQEPAIRSLLRTVAATMGMSVKHSPTYHSQSQGAVERWHQTLWATCRTMKAAIKENYKMVVDATTPIMAWIVKHASWLHNRYQLHSDGKTSYERRWNTHYNKAICEF